MHRITLCEKYTYLLVDHMKLVVFRYTWQIYSDRLLTLAGVYGFWKYVSKLDRLEIRRYLEMFYALKYRKLVSLNIEHLKLEKC